MSKTAPGAAFSLRSSVGTLTLTREIGKGISAVVYSSQAENGLQYAVKAIRNKPGVKHYRRALNEIAMHTHAGGHYNIVPLLDIVLEPTEEWPAFTYLVQPLASMDLYSLIRDSHLFLNNPPLIQSAFLQIISAVQHCHALGVFHRDIKCENILTFDEGRRVMLTDFGLATTSTHSRDWGIGTITYMSPECIGRPHKPEQGYSHVANDVWSLGIVLINLLAADVPWRKATFGDSSFLAYCRDPDDYLVRTLPFSWQAHKILSRILIEERHRLSVTELLESVVATRVWYDADAVFEGHKARWREPEACTTLGGWEGQSRGSSLEPYSSVNCALPPFQIHRVEGLLPEFPPTFVTTNDGHSIAEASYLNIERDPRPWLP